MNVNGNVATGIVNMVPDVVDKIGNIINTKKNNAE